MANELDDILGEEEKLEPKKEEGSEKPAEDLEGLVKAKQALESKREELRKEITELRKTRRELQEEVPRVVEEKPVAEQPKESNAPQTAEDWLKHIKETSDTAANSTVGKLREITKKKAVKSFLEIHSEYSPDRDDGLKLERLMGLAKKLGSETDELDAELFAERLEDAWAVENRKSIVERDRRFQEAKEESEQETADVATSGSGSYERSGTSPATSNDLRMARKLGMTVEKYQKLSRQLEEAELKL